MPTRLFDPGQSDVLYVVDLSGYVFRAYHAIAPLSSPSGEPTQAVLGTVNMLEKLLKRCKPCLLAVAMDSRTTTFRKQLYPGYKANRPAPPEDLRQQMQRVAEVIAAWRLPILQQDGFEADDLIASAVRQARESKFRTVIVSADKDLMQLVGDDVVMWDTMRERVFGSEEVKARFGVAIDQVRDLLALTGDSSDNIPGVPSVGPKTARDLLLEHGDLDGIFAHLGDIKRKKLRQTLTDNEQQARLSQKLVTLRDDVPIDFGKSQLTVRARNVARLRELYTELGFQRQLAMLPAGDDGADDANPESAARAASATEVSAAGGSKASYVTEPTLRALLDPDELSTYARTCKQRGRIALHPMTTAGHVVGMGIACAADDAVYVPFGHRYLAAPKQPSFERFCEIFGPVLSDPKLEKVAHDAKALMVALRGAGAELAGLVFDSLLASYLLDPAARHDLASVAKAELNADLPPTDGAATGGKRGKAVPFDQLEIEQAVALGARPAALLLPLSEALAQHLDDEGLMPVSRNIELPLTELLASLEVTGVLVDCEILGKIGSQVDKQITKLEQQAHQIVGKEFNVNAPRQLETILFDELDLKPIKRTKTSRSTDAATLEALAEQHELPRVILEYRQLAKLKGTYIDALPKLVSKATGRIHTRWGQAVAATGRLSSSDPNLQNIPIRSEVGRAIRGAFVAPPGQLLVSADYSQIELRVLAHLSEDEVLCEAFKNGEDVHTRTAMEIFEVSEDEVTSELRRRAKAVNFGVVYGQGDSGLAKSLGISRGEAGSFIAAYFRRYQGVQAFMDATLAKARAGDSVRTLFGRRRMLPDINSANRARRLAAERIAMNMPIQGTAADLLKMAMLQVGESPVPGSRMILTVHDELVFEVPEDQVTKAEKRIVDIMENVHPLRVPLVVDAGHGRSWSDAH